MAKTTYRMCGGLAIMPDRDMAMLKRMSAQGWHVVDLDTVLLYRFEQGEPHDYDYAVGQERTFGPQAEELYRAAGWTPVVAANGYQVLRAEAGTTPLYTDEESQKDALRANRAWMGKRAAAFLALSLLLLAWERFGGSPFALIASLVPLAGFVFTFLPFLGYSVSLWKTRRSL